MNGNYISVDGHFFFGRGMGVYPRKRQFIKTKPSYDVLEKKKSKNIHPCGLHETQGHQY